METKVCRKCGSIKTITNFGNKKSSKDGLMNSCKECEKNRRREYALKFPDKIQQSRITWSQNNPDYVHPINKEKERERSRDFRKNNPQKRKEIVQRSNIKRRGNIATYMRERRKSIPEPDIIYSMLNRVIKLKKGIKETKSERLLGWNRNEFIEVIGNRPNKNYHLDHKVPISAFDLKTTPINLINSLSNLHWITSYDNLSKNNRYTHPIKLDYFNQIKQYLLPNWESKIIIM